MLLTWADNKHGPLFSVGIKAMMPRNAERANTGKFPGAASGLVIVQLRSRGEGRKGKGMDSIWVSQFMIQFGYEGRVKGWGEI